MPTGYEIYQTYSKGPAALIRLFEQVLSTQAIQGQPTADQQQRTINAQAKQIDLLKSQIVRLQQELGELQNLNFQLARRNSELEGRLVKDSHNPSHPPSSDHPALKRTRSLSRPSGKRVGGPHTASGGPPQSSAAPSPATMPQLSFTLAGSTGSAS